MEALSVVRGAAAIGPGVALFGYALRNLAKDWASRAWPSVEGRIDVVRGVHGYRGIRSLQLTYEYSVHGRQYVGTRYSFGWPVGLAGGTNVDRFIKQHPRGSTVRVYHNPNEPAEALIMPGRSLGHLFGFAISLAFVAGGLLTLRG
ncbi:MAG TPA: DUF3592 domain-containing protein [Candidatus Margulisiibacteriota bacterium]|nr:DUF3592 domain-containing protein [Candidatus Margulisiibacteriota bacterium]